MNAYGPCAVRTINCAILTARAHTLLGDHERAFAALNDMHNAVLSESCPESLALTTLHEELEAARPLAPRSVSSDTSTIP